MISLPKSLVATLLSAAPAVFAQDVDLSWYPPNDSQINNLTSVINGEGVYGFIFNTSDTSDADYGTYNWCNMPHARKTEYVRPSCEHELVYVEVVRHRGC